MVGAAERATIAGELTFRKGRELSSKLEFFAQAIQERQEEADGDHKDHDESI